MIANNRFWHRQDGSVMVQASGPDPAHRALVGGFTVQNVN